MKIRHKQSGVELDLGDIQACSPQPYPPGSFWPGKNGSRYDVAEWEEVQPAPERWRNATDECFGVMYHVPPGYRLFKVWAHGLDPDANAFIMQKPEP
jgi:hypothetical protein